jgi:hypothetical protein
MGLSKAQKTCVVGAAVLLVGVIAILFDRAASRSQRQFLDDGSLLSLNRVVVGEHVRMVHGTRMAKVLGNLIPSNGVHVLTFNLKRPTAEDFECRGRTWLVAELKLSGTKAAPHPLVTPAFYRQFRIVIYGNEGIEFVEANSNVGAGTNANHQIRRRPRVSPGKGHRANGSLPDQ